MLSKRVKRHKDQPLENQRKCSFETQLSFYVFGKNRDILRIMIII